MRNQRVSIIVVNFNGRGLLEQLLPSVLHQSYPKDLYEVIVVDNNSRDDSVPFLKKNYPKILLVESPQNLGFTGGNELGLSKASGDYIALLNSDIVVDKFWLERLVEAAAPPEVGIVNSRLRYNVPFVEVTIKSDVVPKSELNHGIDHSPISVLVEDVLCEKQSQSRLVQYSSGFYPTRESEVRIWGSNGAGRLLLPFDLDKNNSIYWLTLHGLQSSDAPNIKVNIMSQGKGLYQIILPPYEVKRVRLKLSRKSYEHKFIWMIQNAGNVLMHSGHGKDRGNTSIIMEREAAQWYEEESDYYLKPHNLVAACGASCLIKRKVIDEVGFLDGHYFMYYEDMEFSLRAWRAGWRIVYAPDSIGYHRHRASTGSGESTFFLEHVERNHLALLLTHFPLSTFIFEFLLFCLRLVLCGAWSFAFQFKDLGSAHKFKVRYLGRKAALKFLWQSWPRLIRSRIALARYWPMDYNRLSKLMY